MLKKKNYQRPLYNDSFYCEYDQAGQLNDNEDIHKRNVKRIFNFDIINCQLILTTRNDAISTLFMV